MNKLTMVLASLVCTTSFALATDTDWPTLAKVGYIENLNFTEGSKDSLNTGKLTPTYQQMAEHGYNVINIAFGKVIGTNISLYDNNYNDHGYAPYGTKQGFINAIDQFHSLREGDKVLLTVGSDQGKRMWNPDQNNHLDLAKNIISFLADHHLDGLDFDLEVGQYSNTEYLYSLISDLRDIAAENSDKFPHGFFVTAAPHLVDSNEFEWAGRHYAGERFTELMVREHNGKPVFDAINAQHYASRINDKSESEAFYITQGFGVPSKTKIIIGKPGSEKATNYGGYKDSLILNQELSLITDPQFGGLMLWTAAHDYYNNWHMDDAINIGGVDPSDPSDPTDPSKYYLQITNTGKATGINVIFNNEVSSDYISPQDNYVVKYSNGGNDKAILDAISGKNNITIQFKSWKGVNTCSTTLNFDSNMNVMIDADSINNCEYKQLP